MTMYPFQEAIAFDPYTRTVAAGAGQVYALADVNHLSPLSPTDENGFPVLLETDAATGYLPRFYVEDHPEVVFKSGEWTKILVTTMALRGEPGTDGAPGPNTVPTIEAVAAYIEDEGNPVHTALGTRTAIEVSTEGTATRAAVEAVAAGKAAVSTAGHAAVSEAAEARTNDIYTRIRLTPDGRYRTTLFHGQPGPVYAANGGTRSEDTTRVLEGTTAQRIVGSAAATMSLAVTMATPVEFGPASVVRALVWLDDPSAVTVVNCNIRQQLTPTVVQWSRSSASTGEPLRAGWNLLTWTASTGDTTGWGQCHRVEINAVTTRATAMTVQSVWTETTPKAQILFIEDRGYSTFVDSGLPDLRANGIPVTWALDPAINGSNPGTKAEAISDEQVAQFYAEGDDMSIHAYDGSVTATMTPEQIKQDALLSHQWLQDRGYYRGRNWRAAWTQNNAPEHEAARPYYAAYATPSGTASLQSWPFMDPYNVARINLHGTSAAQMDAYFEVLERCHGLMVCYTHGIHPDGGADMTPDQWAYFMIKIEEAMAGGWLEGVTFSQLLERSAGVLR